MPAVLLIVALVVAGLVNAQAATAAEQRAPAQFVAKLYSEALGRIADPAGWSWHLRELQTHGCTPERVRATVRSIYTSAEFTELPYDSESRVLALYRGALNREPDQAGLEHHAATLRSGTVTWQQVVEKFVDSGELTDLAARICGTDTSYHYGDIPAPNLSPIGSGFRNGTGAALQSQLNAARPGAAVFLAQKATVRLTSTLVVPAGTTLATIGMPTPNQYARQGRLVRSAAFDGPLVRLERGARLRNVWVDGQRGNFRNYLLTAINVQMLGGNGTTVAGSKLSNSMGWTNLQAFGSAEGSPCAGATIRDNVVTAYSSEHFPYDGQGRWTDGISVGCEHAVVERNDIIDATDVGIVLFRATPAVQRSVVRENRVLSAGNSAYGAIGVDGLYDKGVTHDFTGASVAANAFWTSPDTHFDIGLAVGSRAWFGTRSDPGTGVTVRDNTTNGLTAVVGTGITVTGMHKATVQGNDLRLLVRPIGACPHVGLGVDADGYAEGGDIQPGGERVSFTIGGIGCLGH